MRWDVWDIECGVLLLKDCPALVRSGILSCLSGLWYVDGHQVVMFAEIYTLGPSIGRGGFAEVFRCHHKVTPRVLAAFSSHPHRSIRIVFISQAKEMSFRNRSHSPSFWPFLCVQRPIFFQNVLKVCLHWKTERGGTQFMQGQDSEGGSGSTNYGVQHVCYQTNLTVA